MSIIATVIGEVILKLKKFTQNRLSPNAKYVIWLVFLVALLFPVAIPSRISVYNYVDISDVKEVRNLEAEHMLKLWKNENNDIILQEDKINDIINNTDKIIKHYFGKIIAYTWFIIFLIQLGRRMFSYYAMSKLAGNDEVDDERIIVLFEKCKKKLKIRRKIKLIVQDFTQMPCTTGVFRVKILVPYSFLEEDDVLITNVLMHELSHYKRKDNVVNFMILILKSLHWFNPRMKKMFTDIRAEMEFATDEVAVRSMDMGQKADYCKSLVMFSASSNSDFEEALGMSSTSRTLEKRIDVIFLQEKFKKNSKFILGATLLITLLICLILYPTSYGMFETPRLYLELENGDKVEVTQIDENTTVNEVKLTQNDKVTLDVKGGRTNDYIFYSRMDPNTMESSEETVNISDGKMAYLESGESIYKFTLTYDNHKTANYAIKIIVE